MSVIKIIHTQKNSRFIFFFLFLLLFNSFRYYARIDFSSTKLFSISTYTNSLLQKIPARMNITYYVSRELSSLYPQTRDIRDLLSLYAASNSNLSFSVTDPRAAGIEKMLDSLGVLPRQIQATEKNRTSFVTVYSAIVLEYEGNTARIPFILSTAGLEYDLNVLVRSLIEGFSREVFVLFGGKTANGESAQSQYSYVLPWLEASGFTCLPITPDILSHLKPGTPLAVIGSASLTAENTAHIERLILGGSPAFFAVSGNTVDITGSWTAVPQKQDFLLNLLDFWGFSLGGGLLLDESNYRLTMQSSAAPVQYQYIDYPFWVRLPPSASNTQTTAGAYFSGLQLYWPSPLFIEANPNLIPLLYSSEHAWIEKAASEAPFFNTDPFYAHSFAGKRGLQVIAAVSEGQLQPFYSASREYADKTGRVLVLSDQYFCSNMVEYSNSPQNIDFLTNSLLWLSGDEQMLALRAKTPSSSALTKITSAANLEDAKKTAFIVVCALPFFAVLAYIIFWAIRIKKGIHYE